MTGSDDLEHPELDAMLERVKLTRGSDDKLNSEVCRVVEFLTLPQFVMATICFGLIFLG